MLGEFNREQEKFKAENRDKKRDASVAPWVGYNEEDEMKKQILALSGVNFISLYIKWMWIFSMIILNIWPAFKNYNWLHIHVAVWMSRNFLFTALVRLYSAPLSSAHEAEICLSSCLRHTQPLNITHFHVVVVRWLGGYFIGRSILQIIN